MWNGKLCTREISFKPSMLMIIRVSISLFEYTINNSFFEPPLSVDQCNICDGILGMLCVAHTRTTTFVQMRETVYTRRSIWIKFIQDHFEFCFSITFDLSLVGIFVLGLYHTHHNEMDHNKLFVLLDRCWLYMIDFKRAFGQIQNELLELRYFSHRTAIYSTRSCWTLHMQITISLIIILIWFIIKTNKKPNILIDTKITLIPSPT